MRSLFGAESGIEAAHMTWPVSRSGSRVQTAPREGLMDGEGQAMAYYNVIVDRIPAARKAKP